MSTLSDKEKQDIQKLSEFLCENSLMDISAKYKISQEQLEKIIFSGSVSIKDIMSVLKLK